MNMPMERISGQKRKWERGRALVDTEGDEKMCRHTLLDTNRSRGNMHSIEGRPFFCSWSGGKDSCLALYHALKQGGKPQCLLTMMAEDGRKSRSHRLPRSLLEEQARQLGIPIVFRPASWDEYEATFLATLHEFRAQGIEAGVFGDIDLEPNREWGVRQCEAAGLWPYHPLWKRPRRALLQEFIDLQFKAIVVVTNAGRLGAEWLGRTIDVQTLQDLERAGVDASGELGEYHTVVTDGPLFQHPARLEARQPLWHEGYWFLDVAG